MKKINKVLSEIIADNNQKITDEMLMEVVEEICDMMCEPLAVHLKIHYEAIEPILMIVQSEIRHNLEKNRYAD